MPPGAVGATTTRSGGPRHPRHLPFFVYGTLLPGERNHRLQAGRTVSWTPAVLPGPLLFHGPGHPYAVPDPEGAGTVHGEVAAIAEENYDEVVADLDRLEDYAPSNMNNLYERVAVNVRTANGDWAVWVYLAADRIAVHLLLLGSRVGMGDWRRSGER